MAKGLVMPAEIVKCLAHAALWMTIGFIVMFNLYTAPEPVLEKETELMCQRPRR